LIKKNFVNELQKKRKFMGYWGYFNQKKRHQIDQVVSVSKYALLPIASNFITLSLYEKCVSSTYVGNGIYCAYHVHLSCSHGQNYRSSHLLRLVGTLSRCLSIITRVLIQGLISAPMVIYDLDFCKKK
jgi:hypothetical protein